MSKEKKDSQAVDFSVYLKEKLKNPDIRKYYDAYGKQLEVAYQILQMRKAKKLSQAELARKLGTSQSDIARMESGSQNFTTDTLERIASALKCRLVIELVK